MSSRLTGLLAPLALSLVACGHTSAVASPTPQAARREWPAPPAATRARLVAVLPDPAAPPRPRPWWQVAVEWITGGALASREAPALVRPFGVALRADGAVFVADPDAGFVARIDGNGALQPVACKDAGWSAPMALAFQPDGTLLVADGGRAAVVRVRGSECRLLAEGAFERPTGIVATPDRIIVADPPRHQLVVLSSDGDLIARWGEQGEGPGQFAFPTSVGLAPDGAVLVTDALNFRVARLDRDGRWQSAFGAPGEEGAGFARPKGIAVDRDGRVFVSDAQRDVILVFSGAGNLEYSIGEPGEAPGQLALPAGLSIAGDRLYVADSQNRRIQVFELFGGTS